MNRKLYDLCRKYRHFYKKHEDVKSWNRKYHDIDLSDVLLKTKSDLNGVIAEIQLELFDVFNICCHNIKEERNTPPTMQSIFGEMKYCGAVDVHCTVDFANSDFFIFLLKEYLEKGNWK